jgi:hypothetical protein
MATKKQVNERLNEMDSSLRTTAEERVTAFQEQGYSDLVEAEFERLQDAAEERLRDEAEERVSAFQEEKYLDLVQEEYHRLRDEAEQWLLDQDGFEE